MAVLRQELTNFIFEIANMLRGPYRPPQYRKVMLPMTVLRRLDLVTAPSKEAIIKEREKLEASGLEGDGLYRALARKVNGGRQQSLYNTSPFTFEKLLGDADNIAPNLVSFINGFSPEARAIFDRFKFDQEIEKLENSNRLFKLIKAFADPEVDLHPDRVSNIEMGLIFEDLVRRFNEQANEEAGDHFTPREVIRLMAHLVFTEDEDVYQKGIARSIYDPTCGTGGMLSVSEEYITEQNPDAHLGLFGQEYNDESWAICCSDLLIKDEPVGNIVLGDTLGDGKTYDGHPDKRFHYMLANPPFGVEWKPQEDVVKKEYDDLGFSGRFGPGLPKISDGATLFPLHMMSKMHPSPDQGGEGSKIAVVFNGSPLFNGEPGPSESNIRRWIIENDMLDAIVALPDQMFYNTGIYTYIWLVTNRKPEARKGKVQLIDATKHFIKMKKSLGDKRKKIGGYEDGEPDQIGEITRLYAQFTHDMTSKVTINGEEVDRVCSKVFDNNDFGYLKVTVERPLRLRFEISADGIEKLRQETAFASLATSKKRKNKEEYLAEIREGEALQNRILNILEAMDHAKVYMDREEWEDDLNATFKAGGEKLSAPIKKAIQTAFGERDENAEICKTAKGEYEPDPGLRDTEIIPLPKDLKLTPKIFGYDKKADNSKLVELVHDHCEGYLAQEVAPYVDQPWIDYSKTKIGYEIPINRHFYVYEPPRPLEQIEADIRDLEGDILKMLKQVGV